MSHFPPWLLLTLFAPLIVSAALAYSRRPPGAMTEAGDDAREGDQRAAAFASETLDIAGTIQEVIDSLRTRARASWVKIGIAVGPGILVHVDPGALMMALRETLLTAIRDAPGGQVMVTAAVLGSQLHIRVTDDGMSADEVRRAALVRGAEAMIALQGGSIDVEARPGKYTTVTIRLPLPSCGGSTARAAKTIGVARRSGRMNRQRRRRALPGGVGSFGLADTAFDASAIFSASRTFLPGALTIRPFVTSARPCILSVTLWMGAQDASRKAALSRCDGPIGRGGERDHHRRTGGASRLHRVGGHQRDRYASDIAGLCEPGQRLLSGVQDERSLCVNTLTPAQEGLSPIFAGMTDHTEEERFTGHDWHTLETGAPVLDKALVVFDCRITQIVEAGTHDVFLCSVEAVRLGTAKEGLIYYGRGYHTIIAAN